MRCGMLVRSPHRGRVVVRLVLRRPGCRGGSRPPRGRSGRAARPLPFASPTAVKSSWAAGCRSDRPAVAGRATGAPCWRDTSTDSVWPMPPDVGSIGSTLVSALASSRYSRLRTPNRRRLRSTLSSPWMTLLMSPVERKGCSRSTLAGDDLFDRGVAGAVRRDSALSTAASTSGGAVLMLMLGSSARRLRGQHVAQLMQLLAGDAEGGAEVLQRGEVGDGRRLRRRRSRRRLLLPVVGQLVDDVDLDAAALEHAAHGIAQDRIAGDRLRLRRRRRRPRVLLMLSLPLSSRTRQRMRIDSSSCRPLQNSTQLQPPLLGVGVVRRLLVEHEEALGEVDAGAGEELRLQRVQGVARAVLIDLHAVGELGHGDGEQRDDGQDDRAARRRARCATAVARISWRRSRGSTSLVIVTVVTVVAVVSPVVVDGRSDRRPSRRRRRSLRASAGRATAAGRRWW